LFDGEVESRSSVESWLRATMKKRTAIDADGLDQVVDRDDVAAPLSTCAAPRRSRAGSPSAR